MNSHWNAVCWPDQGMVEAAAGTFRGHPGSDFFQQVKTSMKGGRTRKQKKKTFEPLIPCRSSHALGGAIRLTLCVCVRVCVCVCVCVVQDVWAGWSFARLLKVATPTCTLLQVTLESDGGFPGSAAT